MQTSRDQVAKQEVTDTHPAQNIAVPDWGATLAASTLEELRALSSIVERDQEGKQFMLVTKKGKLMVRDQEPVVQRLL